MQNYKDSDYALNRYSEGIVYRFADRIVEVTLADYLAENPGKTEADFRALKDISDGDYFKQDRADNAQTKKDKPLNTAAPLYAISPEEILIGAIDARDEAEKRRKRLETARQILGELTEIQRRRYLMYAVVGLTLRQIADKEGTNHKSVFESLQGAEKKIKKFLTKG